MKPSLINVSYINMDTGQTLVLSAVSTGSDLPVPADQMQIGEDIYNVMGRRWSSDALGTICSVVEVYLKKSKATV